MTWHSKTWTPHQAPRRPSSRSFGKGRSGAPVFGARRSGPSWRGRGREWHFPWRGILVALLAAACGYGLWYVIWSPFFQVKEVAVAGASVETEAAIRMALDERLGSKSFGFLPQRNVLIFSVNAAREAVGARVYLENLSLRKSFKGKILVEVKEKEPRAILVSKEGLFVTDSDGYVLRSLTEGESIRLGTLPEEMGAVTTYEAGSVSVDVRSLSAALTDGAETTDEAGAILTTAPATTSGLPWPSFRVDERGEDERRRLPSPVPGVQVATPIALSIILEGSRQVPEAVGVGVRWFTVLPTAETVEALTTTGWTAYFTMARPLGPQITNLAAVLKVQVGVRLPELLYVDLRYGEKIFLNYRESAPAASPEKDE